MVKSKRSRKTRTKKNKKINLELCPYCKKEMRKHTKICPYCASPLTENLHSCPYCKMRIHKKIKGGSCGAFGCPIAPLSVSQMKQMGGMNMGGMNMPGPFVGSAWTGSVANWPGVNGVSNDKNYLELNKYEPVDISRQMELNDTQIGGKKSRKHKKSRKSRKSRKNKKSRKIKGGMRNDILNLGRDIMHNYNSAYNTLNGYPAPVDPAPYKGHFVSSQRIII
jgi:hypothetical protein